MPFNLATWLAPIISLVSLYAAQKSYIAITNLRQYEERSERAAKYSDTAAHQLWKTRATQGSSAGAVSPFSFHHCFIPEGSQYQDAGW